MTITVRGKIFTNDGYTAIRLCLSHIVMTVHTPTGLLVTVSTGDTIIVEDPEEQKRLLAAWT